MSTRDERVVSLKFDNAQFERGASQSMSTLDKLNEKLKFKDVDKNIDKMQKSVDSVTFDKIQHSLESLEKRFSVMGIAGMRVIENLVDKALSGLGKIEQATIGQIRQGGWSRAMNLANAQFQIEGLGYAWEQVEKAVSYGVNETAYGLDAAASAASQLAASGVDFTKVLYNVGSEGITQMHKALRAISGVAAMTNSEYSDISRIFTRVAGQGRVMASDLNSIAARGLNAAAELGKYLKISEADVRDLVSKGVIDFQTFSDAMDSAFGAHAKEANKTFQGSLSNMKAALSRIGAIFATPVINNTNRIFNAITGVVNKAKQSLSDYSVEQDGVEYKIEGFQTVFANAYSTMTDAVVDFIEGLNPTWFRTIGDKLTMTAYRMQDFFRQFKEVVNGITDTMDTAKDIINISVEDAIAAFDIFFNGKYGNGKARVKALEQAGRDAKAVQALINDWYKAGFDPAKMALKITDTNAQDLAEWLEEVRKNGYKLTETNKKLGESTNDVEDDMAGLADETVRMYETFKYVAESLLTVKDIVVTSLETIGNVIKGILDSFARNINGLQGAKDLRDFLAEVFDILSWAHYLLDFRGLEGITVQLEELRAELEHGVNGNKQGILQEIEALQMEAEPIRRTQAFLDGLVRTLLNIWTVSKNVGKAIFNVAKAIFRAFTNVFNPEKVSGGLEEVSGGVVSFSEGLILFSEKIAPMVEGAFTLIFSAIGAAASIIKNAVTTVLDFVNGLLGVGKAEKEVVSEGSEIPTTFEIIGGVLAGFAETVAKIPELLGKLFDKISETDGVQRLSDALSTLGGVIFDAFGMLFGAGAGVAEAFSEEDKTESAIDTIASAIGWLADKLAIVIELIPAVATTIKNFFTDMAGTISGFFSDVNQDAADFTNNNSVMAAIDNTQSMISDAVDPEKSASVFAKFKEFFTNIGKAIKSGFESVNWDNVKSFAIIGALIFSLYKMSKVTDAVASVPKSLSKLFKGLGSMFNNYGIAAKEGAKWAGRVAFLKTLVWALVTLAATIVILGSLDKEKLSRGLAIMLFLTLTITLIVNAFANMFAKKQANIMSMQGVVNVQNNVGALASIALMIAGLGITLYAIAKMMAVFDNLKNPGRTFLIFAGVLILTTAAIGGIVATLVLLSKELQPLRNYKIVKGKETASKFFNSASGGGVSDTESSPLTGALFGLASVMLTIGLAVIAMSVAAVLLEKTKVTWKGILALAGVIGILTLSMVAMMKATKGVDIWVMLGIAAAILSMALALKLVAKSVILIIGEMAAISRFGGTAGMSGALFAIAGIIGIILAIGAAVALIGKALTYMDLKAVWAIPVIILTLVGVIAAITVALGYLSAISNKGGLEESAIVLGILVSAVLGVFAAVMYALSSKDASAGVLFGFAAGLVAVGGAAYLFALAMERIGKLGDNEYKKATKAMVIFFVAIGAILALLTFSKRGIAVLQKLGDFILSIGLSALSIGAGLLLFGLALGVVNASLPMFGEGLGKVFEAVERHWKGALLLIALLLVIKKFLEPIGIVLKGLAKGLASIAEYISKGIGSFIGGAIGLFEGLWDALGTFFKEKGPKIVEFFKNIGKKVKDWIVGLPNKIKALLTVLMISLGASIGAEDGSVSLLGTIGKVLKKLLNYLKEGMPAFVGEILDLILAAIDALAGGIRKRSNRFAAAFWIIVSTFVGLFADILSQGLGMLGIKVSWDDVTDKFYKKAAYNSDAAYLKDMKEAYEMGEVGYDEVLKAENAMIASQKALTEVMGDEVEQMALGGKSGNGFGRIFDQSKNLDTDILTMRNLVTKLDEVKTAAIAGGKDLGDALNDEFKAASEALGDDNAKYLYTALNQMGLSSLSELNTEEGFKKVMEFAALREAVELEQGKMADLETQLGLAQGTLYDQRSKTDWADNDHKEASWFLTVFAPYLKTDQKYIDIRNEMLSDLDKSLDYQAEVQAKAYNIVHGTAEDEKKLAEELKAANKEREELEKLYGSHTDFYNRQKAIETAKGNLYDYNNEYAKTLRGNLNYNMSQGYDVRSDYFYANAMADGFMNVFGDGILKGINDCRDIVVTGFQGMATNEEIIAAAKKAGTQNGKDYTTAAADGIAEESDSPETKKKLNISIDNVKKYLSEKAPEFFTNGGEIGDNLLKGMSNAFGIDTEEMKTLLKAVKESDDEVINVAKSGYGEKSPSKVFHQIGSYLIEGLSGGITAETGVATDAMSTTSQKVIDAFGDPLDYVSKVMSGELTYDPSIRPVMDMSSVSGSAASIQGMFQNQNVAVSGFSGRLAADIGQLQRDNQDVVDEISALREDMAVMTEQITNLQVVMDNGVLVGQIAGNMDQELGIRATRKGRGI